MRATLALTLPLLGLAACGGGGGGDTVSAGTVAPPAGVAGGATTSAGAGAGTSAATSPGSTSPANSGSSAGTPTPTPPPAPAQSNMFDVAAATGFDVVGGFQQLGITKTGATLYTANASTAAQPAGKITYNPRDGVFTVEITDSGMNLNKRINYQDPRHRADADDARFGEYQVPLLAGYNYLQSLDGDAQFTFFYKRPGTTGAFVSLAGYERSFKNATTPEATSDQGALVFGAKTNTLQVPNKGAGRYEGEFLASMVAMTNGSAKVLQWIDGRSAVDVDFGKRTVGLSLNGTVHPAYVKSVAVNDQALTITSGSIFTATGSASWAAGGVDFAGKFSSAGFKVGGSDVPIDFASVSNGGAGASSIDGAFYGPNAINVGGSFRITGGVPNQRVDVLGAFTGGKK